MQTMRYLRRVATAFTIAGVVTFSGAGLIVWLGAGIGWCYGLVACVTAVTTYRMLVPALGDPPKRLRELRRRRRERRLPRPIH